MPAFNAAPTVAAAIESVRAQSFPDWELLIADDGSTDETVSIAHSQAKIDPRVQIFPFPRRGVYSALKELSSFARGEFIGQCDSDDLLAPAALTESLKAMQSHPDCGVVFSDHLVLDSAGKALGIGKRSQIPFSPQALLTDFISFHFRLMRRVVFEQCGGFDATYSAAGDYDLCLRLSEITSFHHIPLPLYGYRINPHSISHKRRIEQIESSIRAVHAALTRRGLDATLELDVEISSKFTLRERIP